MNDRHDDADVQAFLDGNSPLSERYQALGREQPPADLDARILARAEQAARVVPLERPTRRWGAALAVAATLLLCVSLVVNLSIRPAGPLDSDSPPVVEFASEQPAEDFRKLERPGAASTSRGEFDTMRRQALPESQPSAGLALTPEKTAGDAVSNAVSRSPGQVPAAAPDLAMQLPAPPLRDDALLAAAIRMLREAAPVADSQRGDQLPAAAADVDAQANARLAEILAAYEANDPDTAWILLQSFRSDYPQHPLSRRLAAELD
jgi:hypothetical protein